MESTNGNATVDFKHKSRPPYPENGSTRECPSAVGASQWHDGPNKDPRRETGKNRDRSHDREWSKDRVVHGRNRENFSKDEPREQRFREDTSPQQQQQQPPPPQQQPQPQPQAFPAYSYNTNPDHAYVENNRRAMNMMSTYNLIAAMNSQWGVASLDGMGMASGSMAVNTTPGMGMAPGMDMTPNPSNPQMNPFTFMGMTGDPNMYGMMGMGNFGQYNMMNASENVIMGPVKEVIHLSKSVLYPPNPNAPPPTTREKPPGCKTAFVGGLPENATEEIIKEVFERCGEILTIRMSKKNFCHIRFANEAFVESALFFSGYRIKIDNKDDAAFTGRIHVDYAQARDDQYEYECQQRALQREARHRERLEQEYFRPPTPPPVVHYSDHEAAVLGEKLRGEDTFQQAVFVLITWLERGECNKRNAGFFYSMIQSTNSHVRRLMNEKLKYEDELNKAKMMLKQQMQGILLQFNEIGKVFGAANLQKVWDHFTKPQRKNIELWKKQTEEIKNAHVEEVLNDRIEDEMDVSEDEDNDSEAKKSDEEGLNEEQQDKTSEALNKLQEENDSLRCQLEASQNETVLLRSESEQEKDLQERQMQALRQALQGMQKEILSLSQKRNKEDAELKELRAFKMRRRDKIDKDSDMEKDDINLTDVDHPETEHQRHSLGLHASGSSSSLSVTESEARWVGLISTFLNVHPFGASIDYICSYLHQIDCTIRARDIESLMKRFPSVFKEESTGIGASLEKKWTFLGFKCQI